MMKQSLQYREVWEIFEINNFFKQWQKVWKKIMTRAFNIHSGISETIAYLTHFQERPEELQK